MRKTVSVEDQLAEVNEALAALLRANCSWPPSESTDNHIARLLKRRKELLKETSKIWTQ